MPQLLDTNRGARAVARSRARVRDLRLAHRLRHGRYPRPEGVNSPSGGPVRIIVVGGGLAGLGTALACARDGHHVTVLERDDTPMPADPDAAFAWQRTGAPQVRHSHAFLARLRNLLRDRAPDVLDELLAAGATEIEFTANLPETLTDRSQRAGDDELVALACRRTTFEWVLRRLVLVGPGVELGAGTD